MLRHLCINNWQLVPYFQQQNPSEKKYRDVKHKTNRVLNETGAPDNTWLLCMQYVCFIMNRMALRSKDWRTPYELLTGETPDISMIYRFCFWDRVYFANLNTRRGENFPSESDESPGRFVGFSESVGHKMTFKVLTDETKIVIYRWRFRLMDTGKNRRIDGGSEAFSNGKFRDEKLDSVVEKSDGDDTDLTGSEACDTMATLGHENTSQAVDSESDEPPGVSDDMTSEDTGTYRKIVQSDEDRPMAQVNMVGLVGRAYLMAPDEDG